MPLILNLCLFFVSLISFSQNTEKGSRFYNNDLFQNKPTDIQGKATVLYTNDFSIPSTWSFSNTSNPSADWQITSNLNLAPIPAFQPAGFSTAFNNYAIINSDAQGTAATQDCILELNTLITQCNNKPFVVLRFHQMLRRFNDTTSLEVSNNGTTWTEFLCNPGLVNNLNTSNPQKIDINISSVAGNQDTVYIRFRYRAADAWFWAIDDVQILEQDQFDLEGLESSFGTIGNWGIEMPYFQVPVEQIAPVAISGKVKNSGHGAQPDAFLSGTSANGYSSNTIPNLITANVTTNLNLPDLWTPASTIGVQTVDLTINSSAVDQVPINNALPPVKVDVNAKYYARSSDIRSGRVSNNFYQYGYETGNIFDIFTDATITSAMVHVNSETTPGMPLYAKLYEAITQDSFVLLSMSDTVIMPSMMNDQVFRVRLISPTLLEANKSYLLTAGSIGSTTFPGLVMGTSGTAEIFTSYFKATNISTWFSFTETAMVKMNFESVLDVSELDKINFTIYPNPANDNIELRFDQVVAEEVDIYIVNTNGQKVIDLTKSQFTSSLKIDVSELANGVYFVHMNSIKNSHTQKLLINR